jgi:hypothetical protein
MFRLALLGFRRIVPSVARTPQRWNGPIVQLLTRRYLTDAPVGTSVVDSVPKPAVDGLSQISSRILQEHGSPTIARTRERTVPSVGDPIEPPVRKGSPRGPAPARMLQGPMSAGDFCKYLSQRLQGPDLNRMASLVRARAVCCPVYLGFDLVFCNPVFL